eukprot:TRINITY_DN24120_c0_g1_i1.p1 TRINITY_DN24120_c0_g1~~TRINITY_DN24120_c0_g1_i1.p1  ORF type:complete len:193 (+),score=9.56 TRINITY_DN24120_c0_g1_i1:173-751(+)
MTTPEGLEGSLRLLSFSSSSSCSAFRNCFSHGTTSGCESSQPRLLEACEAEDDDDVNTPTGGRRTLRTPPYLELGRGFNCEGSSRSFWRKAYPFGSGLRVAGPRCIARPFSTVTVPTSLTATLPAGTTTATSLMTHGDVVTSSSVSIREGRGGVAWTATPYSALIPVSYTHLRAHETPEHLVCRLLLEKKKN